MKKSKDAKKAIKEIRKNPSRRAQILDEVGHTKGYRSKDAADVNYSRASQKAYKKGIRDEVKLNKTTRKEVKDFAGGALKSEAKSIKRRSNKTNRKVARIDKKIINKASRAYRSGKSDVKDGEFRTAPKVSNKIDKLQNKRIEVLNSPAFKYSGTSPAMRKLSASCKAAARRKFDVYPSAYANMWASKRQRQGKC